MIDTTRKEIILLNFFKEGPLLTENINFGDSEYHITEHKIGWDFETGCDLIKQYDYRNS